MSIYRMNSRDDCLSIWSHKLESYKVNANQAIKFKLGWNQFCLAFFFIMVSFYVCYLENFSEK